MARNRCSPESGALFPPLSCVYVVDSPFGRIGTFLAEMEALTPAISCPSSVRAAATLDSKSHGWFLLLLVAHLVCFFFFSRAWWRFFPPLSPFFSPVSTHSRPRAPTKGRPGVVPRPSQITPFFSKGCWSLFFAFDLSGLNCIGPGGGTAEPPPLLCLALSGGVPGGLEFEEDTVLCIGRGFSFPCAGRRFPMASPVAQRRPLPLPVPPLIFFDRILHLGREGLGRPANVILVAVIPSFFPRSMAYREGSVAFP